MASSTNSNESNNDNFMDSPKIDFMDSKVFHDRIILITKQKFYVQSGVLSLWSEFFRLLFNSDFKEKDEKEIVLRDLDTNDFAIFLQTIYPGRCQIIASHLKPLITLSYRFLAPGVLDKCKQYIEKNMKQVDKSVILDLACLYNIKDIKEKTMNYLKNQKHFPGSDIIELLKCAFKNDLEPLKKLLRHSIHGAPLTNSWFACDKCPHRLQLTTCTHVALRTTPMNRNSFLADHWQKILTLPEDHKDFIIKAVVDSELI